MNEAQYLQVCESCDQLLTAKDSTLSRIAISWLHVLNEHPTILSKYIGLFNTPRVDLREITRRTGSLLWSMKHWFNGEKLWHEPEVLPSHTQVLIVSHLLNESQIGEPEDFYFGQLSETLTKKGISAVIALRDHTGLSLQGLAKRWAFGMTPRLLFSSSLGCLGELKLRSRLRKEAKQLRAARNENQSLLEKQIRQVAAAQALAPSTITTLRLYYQVQKMVACLRPASIVVTYEGHAWEHLVFAAARSINPSIRCVGYHHAILFPRQHALKRRLGSKYDPDIICMGGNITRDALEQTSELSNIALVTVGTHRQEQFSQSALYTKFAHPTSACLVIPDGTVDECLTIFSFIIAAAAAAPTINFIIRMHPVMSFAVVAKKDERLLSLPQNVQISDQSIQADFDRSRWALYRGSGAAIRAVAAGLRPFYFKPLDEQLGIDPLYKLNTWRCIVTRPDELLERIHRDMQSDIEVLLSESAKARQFCAEYFTPVDLEKFCQHILGEKA